MYMVLSIARSVGLTLASAMMGMLVCVVLWQAFKLVRHPEWGPPLILVPIASALAGQLPDSEFLRRSLVFAAILAGPFWIAGLAWRIGLRERERAARATEAKGSGSSGDIKLTPSTDRQPLYPAITGCICEDRRPSPSELKRVARRISREALTARQPTPSFAEKRMSLRAARTALEGLANP